MAKPRTQLDDDSKPRPRRRPERRSVLKPSLVKKFCVYVETGLPADAVCDLMCIANTTYYDWMRKGEQYLVDPDDEEFEDFYIYGSFVLEVRMAFARYRQKLQNCINTPGVDWRRALGVLERRDRFTYAKSEQAGGLAEDYDPDEKFL